MIQVRKRDGSLVPFDLSKIKNAILKDLKAIHHEGNIDDIATHYANRVDGLCREKYLGKSEIFDIENIQDTVVQVLASEGEVRAVIAYCEYRYQHKLEREHRIKKTYEDKLMAKNVVNQNANIDEYSGGGRSGEAANVYEKQYALEHCMSKLARTNHENNEVYIHDLNKYAIGFHNCLSIPFDDLLSKGFHTRQGDVRPAGSLNTAMQLVAVIFQLQSLNQFGGVSATHLDWTMVPYFRKSFMKHYIVAWAKSQDSFGDTDFIKLYDETYTDAVGVIRSVFDEWCDKNKDSFFAATGLTKDDFTLANKEKLDNKLYNSALCDTLQELRQAVEAMYHNLNTLQSRSGDQLPFTSINYGTCTFEEGRLVTRALLLGSLEGIGFHHNTPIFPCGIYERSKRSRGNTELRPEATGHEVDVATPLSQLRQRGLEWQRGLRPQRSAHIFLNDGMPHGKRFRHKRLRTVEGRARQYLPNHHHYANAGHGSRRRCGEVYDAFRPENTRSQGYFN